MASVGFTGQYLFDLTAQVSREVRLSGEPGEAKSFATVKSLLDKAGLSTRLIQHDAYISLPVEGYILAAGERIDGITHAFSRQTPKDGLNARIVDAGMDAPAGNSARGTVVLSDGIAMPGLVQRNENAGAAAQIFVCGKHTHEMCISTVWGSPTPDDLDRMPKSAVVSVTDVGGRRLRELIAGGLTEVTIHTEVDTGWRKIPLLTADLCPPGIDSLDASGTPFMLFSGHLDSWYYGAMDNGSANAVMIGVATELAKQREQLKRGLRLAFWSGHSHGRYAGSAWYVDEHHHALQQRCFLHLNIDSAGGKGATVLTDAVAMPSTIDCGARAIAAETGQELIGSRVSRAGDQSFIQLGIPSLFMSISEQPPTESVTSRAFGGLVAGSRTGGLGWWWHTTEDTLDKLDLGNLERDGRIYLQTCTELLCEAVAPIRLDKQSAALLAELREIAARSRPWLDLDGTVLLAARVSEALEQLQQSRDRSASENNEALLAALAALRPVVEITYAGSGQFAHDRTIPIPPVPQLASAKSLADLDEASRQSRLVALRRARNYVEARLREALAQAEHALAAHASKVGTGSR